MSRAIVFAAFLLAGCRPNQAKNVDDLDAPSDRVARGLRGQRLDDFYSDPSTVTFKAQAEAAHLFVAPNPLYVPSECERHVVEHAEQLGFASENDPPTCQIWKDPDVTGDECNFDAYAASMDAYNAAVANFEPIPDILPSIQRGDYSVCSATKLHQDGLGAYFQQTQLSHSSSGYIEPLLPPMRSAKIWSVTVSLIVPVLIFVQRSFTLTSCLRLAAHLIPPHPSPALVLISYKKTQMMAMDYFVHDFEVMCHKLKPTSRRVLIDMGASLSFHRKGKLAPIVHLLDLYEKFGFHFDHIYGFEITFSEPQGELKFGNYKNHFFGILRRQSIDICDT